MRRATLPPTPLLLLALLALALLALPAEASSGRLRRGQRAETDKFDAATQMAEAADGAALAVPAAAAAAAARRSAMARMGQLRLRLRARAAEGESQSALAAGAAATLTAVAQLPFRVSGRGAGGKAGRAGGRAGDAAGNGGQSGRKAGDARGNGGQSGRKAGDARGNGGQSGRKAGDASGNGGQSGRKGGDASGNGGQSGRKAGDASGPRLPVSPIAGSPPPDSTNVVRLAAVKRYWPVNVYLRNQGDAATCWAHSAVTLLELRQQMGWDRNRLFDWISVDQVLRCVPNDGAAGGNPLDAISFLLAADRQADKDVRAGQPIRCDKWRFSGSMNSLMSQTSGRYPVLALKPCVQPGENCLRMRDYEFEMERQFTHTPMLVYVDASQWHRYAPRFTRSGEDRYALGTASDYSGVAFPTTLCSMDPAKGDHIAILLGTVTCPRTKRKYWRVYNSWGREWGVNGYIYLPYEVNACGLANYPVGLAELAFRSRQAGSLTRDAVLMLPKTMTRAAGLMSAEYKLAGAAAMGGKEEWDEMQRTSRPN